MSTLPPRSTMATDGAMEHAFSVALIRARRGARVLIGDSEARLSTRGNKIVAGLLAASPDTLSQVERLLAGVLAGDGIPADVVSPAAAAALLGVSRPTVVRWAREGLLTDHRVGAHHRFDRSEVMELYRVRAERAVRNRTAAAQARADTVASGQDLDVAPTPAELVAAGEAARKGDRATARRVLTAARRADARRAAAAAGALPEA